MQVAAEMLVEWAEKEGFCDNITVVVRLQDPSAQEK